MLNWVLFLEKIVTANFLFVNLVSDLRGHKAGQYFGLFTYFFIQAHSETQTESLASLVKVIPHFPICKP